MGISLYGVPHALAFMALASWMVKTTSPHTGLLYLSISCFVNKNGLDLR